MTMIEKDLENLRNTAPSVGLDSLESAIWQRVAADAETARRRQIILGWQAGALALVVATGLALGRPAQDRLGVPHTDGLEAFSLEGVPAPSTLLMGSHT